VLETPGHGMSAGRDLVAISANSAPSRFAWWSLPVLADSHHGGGPLAAVARDLAHRLLPALDMLLRRARADDTISTSVRRFADEIGVREGAIDPFFNVNAPEDHSVALDIVLFARGETL
jgi:molybdopterin-guanine dinucleotide biosynthesis protein A